MNNKLRELRQKSGYTQVQLAKILYVRQSSVSAWESGAAKPDFDNQRKLAELYNVSIDELFGREVNNRGVKIPVLGRVQAGIPIDSIEEILDYEEIPENMASQGEFFGLIIRGDSMFPKIVEDDVVIVRKQSDCDNGDIAVVLINGNEATIKKIKKTPSGITLVPLNVNYECMSYSIAEIESLPVTIIGKVVELRRKF